MVNEYRLQSVPMMDVLAGLTQSARIAREEGMPQTAERCSALVLHMRNATDAMADLCPAGHRLEVELCFSFKPIVNPTARR